MISVVVPVGAIAGTTLQIQSPSRQTLHASVPAGVRPGQIFQVIEPSLTTDSVWPNSPCQWGVGVTTRPPTTLQPTQAPASSRAEDPMLQKARQLQKEFGGFAGAEYLHKNIAGERWGITAKELEHGFVKKAMVPGSGVCPGGVVSFGGDQESDRLEALPAKVCDVLAGTGTDHVRLVSLGCMCAPKLSFKQLGRGSETLPFDWIRARIEAVLHFLRNDFQGFFDYATVTPVSGMTMYRSRHHSFWHDNPDDPGMRDRYSRRIKRYQEIRSTEEEPVLFVRAVACTDELALVPELLTELMIRHGPSSHLLIILDFQFRFAGLATLQGYKNLLVCFHRAEDREPAAAPYMKPVAAALQWVVGTTPRTREFSDITDLYKVVDPNQWGYNAGDGMEAFEDTSRNDLLKGLTLPRSNQHITL